VLRSKVTFCILVSLAVKSRRKMRALGGGQIQLDACVKLDVVMHRDTNT
jgi:hypothetical protein